MSNKQKLELTWIGKDVRPKLEPRILLEDASRSYHAAQRVTENDSFDNRLIFGDNLLALKALEQEFAGKVKCVFIDPPYNTGSAFAHYDDGVEHSIWLSLMGDRLELIRRMLSRDGSLWITIDDNEAHYLRVLCDEIFGRKCFVANCVWQKRYARDNNAAIGSAHDHVLVDAVNPDSFRSNRNRLNAEKKANAAYKNPNNDPRWPWQSISFTGAGYRTNQMYRINAPNGQVHLPPEGRHWATVESEYERLRSEGRFWFGREGNGVPRLIRYRSEVEGVVPSTWWPHTEVGHNDEAKKEIHTLFGKANAFDTPKPERLVYRILQIATNPGDLVLDSFAGSGTTGAVAHKIGRRWIMVELGEHCHTHIIPRLEKVFAGEDPGGVTAVTEWKGGGGFRYYRLAPSLLQQDSWGQWVVNKEYNAEMLAAALCKLEGFTYAPSDEHYWQHGYSSEQDYIYVTTQSLSAEQLRSLSDEVGSARSLLVCCGAFRGDANHHENLTVKKIPKMLLKKCEWGHDDYSLNVANLPAALKSEVAPARQSGLFDDAEAGR